MAIGDPNPGSSKKGGIDTRSSDAKGKQADEVKPHAERAAETPAGPAPRGDETKGAFKDQVGH